MNNLNGILLMTGGMVGFTFEDMFIKMLTATLPVGQVLVLIAAGSAAVFLALSVALRHRPFARAAWRPVLVIRAACEAIAALCFVTALASVDLSVVAAVFQALPLVITMGAALFLGEQVGWRRWTAISLGFVGVLLIIRPGMAGFEPRALLVLISVLAVAARDLITRRIDVTVPSTVVSFQGFAAVIPAALVLLALSPDRAALPDTAEWWKAAGGVTFGALGYYAVTASMRLADVGALMPFRYTRLVFSMLVGMVVFHERPDAITLAGAALIIATGFYTFLREQRLARAA
ncbi:DMT family transporter [Actibacterium ureilyticum]|uniref:DMT family transporter n=1 Tax=Actibacterium ureilyticum TaxID=1590614 RepID=UPI000BAAB6B3|nr:DMT family transporter [Actibacterium ureilyticum]